MKTTLERLARDLAIGTVIGIFAGFIAGGLGSRLAMRITALLTSDHLQGQLTEAQARVGEITLGGTFFLVFLASLLGIYGGLVYRISFSRLPIKNWLKGLVFGLLLLLIHGTVLIEGDNFDFARFGNLGLNLLMFMLLPLIFGLLAAYSEAWLERKYPTFTLRPLPLLLYLPALLGGLLLVLVTVNALDWRNARDGLFGSVEQAQLVLLMLIVMLLNCLFAGRLRQLRYGLQVQLALLILPALYGVSLLAGAIFEIVS